MRLSPMSSIFHVIGFDARTPPNLSRLGHPYTIDRDIWNSGVFGSTPEDYGFSGTLQFLWNDFQDLKSEVQRRSFCGDVVFLGLTWSFELAQLENFLPKGIPEEKDGIYWAFPRIKGCPDPARLSAPWVFLGFDVGDGWLMSGIWNFGLGFEFGPFRIPQEIQLSRALLNSHGLFQNLADAVNYAKLVNPLVKEHAPFSPYGVWRIGE